MEINKEEVGKLEQELFQEDQNIAHWALDIETIPRKLNDYETEVLREKIEYDYDPENISLGNRTKPETIEKFLAEKMEEKEQKLLSLEKGDSRNPLECIIVSFSLAAYKQPDQSLINQIKSSAEILKYNGISTDQDELNSRISELKSKDIITVDRVLDRTNGDYPTKEQYNQFLQNLSGKLQSVKGIVTFNGNNFDVPAIKNAFLMNNIVIPNCLDNSTDISWFFRTRDFNGKPIFPSLKKLAALYLEINIEGDGSEIEQYWLSGNIQKIVEHNQSDTIATLLLANKIWKVLPQYFGG